MDALLGVLTRKTRTIFKTQSSVSAEVARILRLANSGEDILLLSATEGVLIPTHRHAKTRPLAQMGELDARPGTRDVSQKAQSAESIRNPVRAA